MADIILICISMGLLSLFNLYEIDKIKDELKNIRNEIEEISMYEDDIVEEIYAYDFHNAVKDEHRKARRTKAKDKKRRKCKPSINNCIGKYASAYGKKMLHRYNRRKLDVAASDYYKHGSYSYSSILWALT